MRLLLWGSLEVRVFSNPRRRDRGAGTRWFHRRDGSRGDNDRWCEIIRAETEGDASQSTGRRVFRPHEAQLPRHQQHVQGSSDQGGRVHCERERHQRRAQRRRRVARLGAQVPGRSAVGALVLFGHPDVLKDLHARIPGQIVFVHAPDHREIPNDVFREASPKESGRRIY